MQVNRAQLRQALIDAGARTRTWQEPDTAETLAAIALAASGSQGEAQSDLVTLRDEKERVGCFQIETRPQATGHGTPRDREWLLADFTHQCLAAVALTYMNGLKMWPEYASDAYQRYIPEAFTPPIKRPEGEIPYQVATVFPGLPLRLLMRACGWIAPSNKDADRIAQLHGHPAAADVPPGFIVRIPVQRGW